MPRSKGRSHDKLYITVKEHIQDWGGKQEKREQLIRPLPFYNCAISLQPWKDPVCTPDGTIYDLVNIIEWLKKYKTDPRTGEKLSPKDLITLKFQQNKEGKWHCPITYKEFTENSHIVAIRTGTSAYVYSYEAVDQMNIKPKNWKDLTTGEPFTKADIIVLQDPNDLEKRKAANFWHIKHGVTLESSESKDPAANMHLSMTAKKTLDELKKREEAEKAAKAAEKAEKSDEFEPVEEEVETYIEPAAAFTFSGQVKATRKEIPKKTKRKGYVRLITNMGNLNIELHCDLTPKTCENFLTLCERGYYKNVIFHRLIKHFMIQGGDPTGTGTGGTSIWGRKFEDEIVPSLSHDSRGVVSMANAGKDTNGSQFFILFRPAKHLDGKHTVFGRLLGGLDVLKEMENVPTDDNDRPLREIKILDTEVYVNPLRKEELEQERKEEEEKERQRLEKEKPEYGKWYSNPGGENAAAATTPTGVASNRLVGKYLQLSEPQTTTSTTKTGKLGLSLPAPTVDNIKKRPLNADTESASKRTKLNSYGDFSNF